MPSDLFSGQDPERDLTPEESDQLNDWWNSPEGKYADTCPFCKGDGKNHDIIAGGRDADDLFWLQYEGARSPFGWLPKNELQHYIDTGRLTPVIEDTLPWSEAEQDYYRTAAQNIQIYPIDNEHNVWFDEDGNQRARYRPGWAKDPETGKMKQTGELEDTFLDKHGRQGQGVVAYDGDTPIGSLTWVDESGWHMLGTTYVHPNYREQGIFSRMVAPLRETGRPIDAYVWNNPWLKSKVRSWR